MMPMITLKLATASSYIWTSSKPFALRVAFITCGASLYGEDVVADGGGDDYRPIKETKEDGGGGAVLWYLEWR
jgi:hypothetical protein